MDDRYFISVSKFTIFQWLRKELIAELGVKKTDVIYVTLSDKHRKQVLKMIKGPVKNSHLIGQWRKSELIELTKDSEEPYSDDLATREQAWLNSQIKKFEMKRRKEGSLL